MCAGPAGQCHNLPDNEDFHEQLALHARNHQRIHDRYNLPDTIVPGSKEDKIHRLHALQVAAAEERQQVHICRSCARLLSCPLLSCRRHLSAARPACCSCLSQQPPHESLWLADRR